MKYTIRYEVQRLEDSSYITIPLVERITRNEAVGDTIGIYHNEDFDILEFDEGLDIEDSEIREFIKTYFNNPKSVIGFIKRLRDR